MRFDELWADADKPEAAAPDQLPLPPDGRHSGTIQKAEIKDVPFKVSQDNPTGRCLVVKVGIKGCRLVEDIIPTQYRGAIEAVCRAARVSTSSGPGDLVDAEVQVETALAVSARGTEYVRLKWIAGPAGTAPAKVERAVARPARAAAKQLAEDDIPF